MTGTALRKYAELHGMTCDGGCAYGKVGRHHIALQDGVGVKVLQIYLHPPEEADERLDGCICAVLSGGDAGRYRLVRQNAIRISCGRAVVVFQDGRDAIRRIGRYIDEILPRLDGVLPENGACACCGRMLGEYTKYVLLDDCVLPVHEGCTGIVPVMQVRNAAQDGSAVKGAAGALLGAALSVIFWVALELLGFVTGVAGFLTGLLSNYLYGRLGGGRGRIRLAVVLTALLLGVAAGQAAGTSALYMGEYAEAGGRAATGLTGAEYVLSCWDECILSDQAASLGRRYDRMLGNIPEGKRQELAGREEYIQTAWDPEYADRCIESRHEMLSNLGIGMLFGLIGCIGMFSQIRRESRRKMIRVLK